MDDWPAYEEFTHTSSAMMDQQTENSVLISSRIGYQVAPHNLRGLVKDWTPVERVRSAGRSPPSSASREPVSKAELNQGNGFHSEYF